jgi:hypothetical protein
MILPIIVMMISSAMMAAEPAAVWQTKGSVTFAAADGANVWVIDASGGIAAPKASLVRIGPSGASRVATFSGYAYSLAADEDFVYLVVDKDIVRVSKRPPHAQKTLKKDEVWPIGVAVGGDYVYITNQSTKDLDGGPRDGKPGSVARMKKNGDGFTKLSEVTARNIVLDANNVYFSSSTSVCAVPRNGGPLRTLVEDTGQESFLAMAGEWLVYTRSNGVSRLNTKRGKVEALAEGIDIPLFVAAANGTTYIGTNMAFQGPGKPPKPAEIIRLRAGRKPERLWSGMNRLTSMVLAGGKLYFSIEPIDGSGGAKVLRMVLGMPLKSAGVSAVSVDRP